MCITIILNINMKNMKKLEIVYEGGYRQVSKYLTLEHDANFSLIIDAIINVHNMNLTKLVTIGRHRAVKVSNGFLSRQTGLGISIIKTNVKKIEEIGLITAIKKGQGNTRHYVINVENINSYIAALQPKFEQWFEKSLEASKKDKARSVEADDNKLKKSLEIFAKTIAKLATYKGESKIGLVENRPTQIAKTRQPNRPKPAVADKAKERAKETTTKKKNVVVDIFNQRDSKGTFIFIKEYGKPVYKKEFQEYTKNYTKDQFEKLLDATHERAIDDLDESDDDLDFDNAASYKKEKKIFSKIYYKNEIMGYTYNLILQAERREKYIMKKEYETTKEPASQDISNNNWKILKNAYSELPNIPNQGKFFTSKQDVYNFSNLSEFRQEWVIEQVVNMKKANTTTSRPSIYIEEAMKEKLNMSYNPVKSIINIGL